MRNLTLIPTTPYKLPPIEDITDKLPKKAPWEPLRKKYTVKGEWDGKTWHTGFRNPEDINTIIIHHSGPPEGTLDSHARYHADKWGAGISYHIAIDQGRIKQLNNLLSFTFHAGGHNTYTVGIVINRDLRNGDLTSQERELLYAAILTVKSLLPIKHILGHNEVNATACPCTSMNRIRADVAALELELERAKAPEKQQELAYRMANQILYLQRMAQHGVDSTGKPVEEGAKKWALAELLKMEKPFREHGWLK
jgi:hypothetical protein